MSGRPGYEELVAVRGRKVADEIINSAETYSDSAHQSWEIALRWAIDEYDRPVDPVLEAQQNENVRLHRDLEARRPDDVRPILYLTLELGGDAYDHPARLAQAEAMYDAEGWRLPSDRRMRDELDWAAARARALIDRPDGDGGG
jgi:hypothetical protein